MDGPPQSSHAHTRQPLLHYEPRAAITFDSDSIKLTHVSGWFTITAWVYAAVWAAAPAAHAFRHSAPSLTLLCLLPLIASVYFVAAILQRPTWWYTRLVGTLLSLLWLFLTITGLTAFIRLAFSQHWFILMP